MVLAMNAGMDSAIVDPTNKNMIGMIYATDALLEQAVYLLDYAERNWSDVKGTFVESLGRYKYGDCLKIRRCKIYQIC